MAKLTIAEYNKINPLFKEVQMVAGTVRPKAKRHKEKNKKWTEEETKRLAEFLRQIDSQLGNEYKKERMVKLCYIFKYRSYKEIKDKLDYLRLSQRKAKT